ncbi:MAG: hypothetical protein K0R61_3549 [Microvirga sp.]|nr:hypothetical protein [Microvirga sp.]
MNRFSRRCLTTILTILCLGVVPSALSAAEPDRDVLADRVTKLSRGTQWGSRFRLFRSTSSPTTRRAW